MDNEKFSQKFFSYRNERSGLRYKKKLRKAGELAHAPEKSEWSHETAKNLFGWIFEKARENWFTRKFRAFGLLCQAISDKTGWKRLSGWMAAFFEPEAALPALEKQSSARETVANLLLATYLIGFATYVPLLALASVLQGRPELAGQGDAVLFPDTYALVFKFLGEPLMNAFQVLLALLLLFLCARLSGSKARLWAPTYAISSSFIGWRAVVACLSAIMVMMTALGVLAGPSAIGMAVSFIAMMVSLAVGLVAIAALVYGFYSIYRMARLGYGLPPFRMAASLLGAFLLSFLANYAMYAILQR